jgi:amino acid adenylation domain-containing protein
LKMENILLSSQRMREEKSYWMKKLSNIIEMSGFPSDYQALQTRKEDKALVNYRIPEAVAGRVFEIGKHSEQGVYMILLSGVLYVLSKYVGSNDIIVGTPILKQKKGEKKDSNILTLRSLIDENSAYKDYLLEVRRNLSEINKYHNFHYEKVAQLLGMDKSEGHIFKTIVLLTNIQDTEAVKDMKADTTFSFTMDNGNISCELEYKPSMFRGETIKQILEHVTGFLRVIADNPNMKLSEIHIMSVEGGRKTPAATDNHKDCIGREEPYEVKDKAPYYPVSYAQSRLFMLDKLEGIGTGYNISLAFTIYGHIDRKQMEAALMRLIERHEVLRTSFTMVDGEIMQKVHENVNFSVEYIEEESSQVKDTLKRFLRPFDLSVAPMFRVALINVGSEQHIVAIDMHHIISDGVSIAVLERELMQLYQENELPKLPLQYRDYAAWQNELFELGMMIKQEKYWLKTLGNDIPLLSLPTDYPRPSIKNFEGAAVQFQVGNELTRKLKNIALENGATLYMVLLAAYNILLSKYASQQEIIVGTPTAGRQYTDLENLVGMFVNTLAIMNYPHGTKTYREFLLEVKSNVLNAFENQDYPFEDLVEKLNIKREISRNPLFDVLFALQNIDFGRNNIGSLTIENYDLEFKTAKFDLSLIGIEVGDRLGFNLEYCTKLFKRQSVEKMTEHYLHILNTIVENPDIKLAQISILQEKEKEQLLYDFNTTNVEYPINRSLNELFEEQVEKSPDKTALIYEDDRLTYRELNSWSNRIAWMLKEKGIKEDMVVGVMAERCLELVAALMGVIKSGAAYVPIDPTYPQERIEYLLKSSKATILLTQDKLKENIKPGESEVISVTGLRCSSDFRTDNLSIEYNPERLLYVLYTSGSTGNPKGVMVKSHSFVNLCTWFADAGDMSEEDTMLLMSSVSFDLTHKNIYAPLLRGGRVCLYRSGLYNYMHMTETAQKESITIMCCTPSVFYPLVELNEDGDYGALSSLRKIFLGGEPLNINRLKKWSKSPNYCAEIINIYGPTECTDIVSLYRIDNGKMDELDNVPIGRPIYNTKLYILDKNLQPVPIGVAGELCVGEVGLARGYYNDEALTAEKFVDTPHLPSKKVYRTGDLVKWLPDINIEFLGRVDFQVKIRGIRIEPGEIENVMLKHPAVKEAVVVAKERRAGDKYLCMYYTLKSQVGEEELREYAKGILPEYMIPEFFIKMDSMSMTNSGKIDRKRLPEPDIDSLREIYVAPSTESELKMTELWQEILGVENIGVHDDFFSLGGHSLNATILTFRLNKELGMDISLNEIFKAPTISELAAFIDSISNSRSGNDSQHLILLKSNGTSEKNFYFVHDGSGEIDAYYAFANNLSPEYNYWGIRAGKITGSWRGSISIEELARRYMKEIKQIQPQGPYYIGGWSIGGTIAFEICRMFEKEGEDVELIGLIDTVAPAPAGSREEDVKEMNAAYDALMEYVENGNPDLETVMELIPQGFVDVVPAYTRNDMDMFLSYINAIRVYSEARDNYVPSTSVNTCVHFFRASGSDYGNEKLWNQYCRKAVRYYEVAGDHFSIFKHPDIIGLTEVFDKAIRNNRS